MPVEFLPEGQDDAAGQPPGPADRRRLSTRVVAVVAALALVVVAAVVVGTNGGGSRHPAAKSSSSPSPSPSTSPSSTKRATLALPESVAFGPEAEDVLADGDRVFALTPTLIGFAVRDSGTVTVRPTPIGLSNQAGHGKLVPDLTNRIIWVVAIGGNAIGAYDTDHLDTLANTLLPYRIRGAVAMDEKLYLTTDHGLWSAEAGPMAPEQISRTARFGAITANLADHQILVADRRSPSRLHVLTSYGAEMVAPLPVAPADSLAVAGDAIWVTGSSAGQARVVRLDSSTLKARELSSLTPPLGSRAQIVGAYGNELLIRSTPGRTLYCTDATTGALKQKWTVPRGAVTLNERGLLITTSDGLAPLNARDCLAG
jgi:hypothetical protein